MYRRGATSLLLAVILVLLQAAAAFGATEQQQLAQARSEKAKKQAELDAAKASDDQLEATIGNLKRQLAEQTPKIEEAKKRSESAEQAVAAAAEQVKRTEKEAERRQSLLNQRAIAAYKTPDAGAADAVLGAVDLAQAGLRMASIQRVIDSDHEAVLVLNQTKTDLEEDKKKFEGERKQAEAARAASQAEFDKTADLKAAEEATQDVLESRMNELKEEVDALAAEEGKIQSTIKSKQAAAEAALKKQQTAPKPVGTSTGAGGKPVPDTGPAGSPSSHGYIWPVHGPVTSGYGQRWGRLHAGIDIGVASGTSVRASAEGIVISAGGQGAYGNLVLIAHGNGVVTAYAHLSSIGAGSGAYVRQGQVIGSSGCTGRCTGPHLHFEVRVNGSPVNPLGYL